MNDLDIQFGELEETQPEVQRRPDRNRHYTVVPVFEPSPRDLPVYVDLDAMRDMEAHALSDTTVELGGVMLGGQYRDEEGRPFVVVSDSLRAEHYEATKGSFKFTHETWARIGREREEFPEAMQMVGWYHTHPGWGVFLSGMDLFICENFFNRPLDLALVIDPEKNDRGIFQWTDGPRRQTRRTGGFHLIASRLRRGELEHFAAQLEGKAAMHDPRSGGFGAPVVNVHGGKETSLWPMVGVMGMVAVQFLLVALIAWQMFGGPRGDDAQLAALVEAIERQTAAEDQRLEIRAQRAALDRIVGGLPAVPDGFFEQMVRAEELQEELDRERRSRDRLVRQLELEQAAVRRELQARVNEELREREKVETELEQSRSSVADLRGRLGERGGEIERLLDRLERHDPEFVAEYRARPGDPAADGWLASVWLWLGIAVAVAVVCLGVVFVVLRRYDEPPDALSSMEFQPHDGPRDDPRDGGAGSFGDAPRENLPDRDPAEPDR